MGSLFLAGLKPPSYSRQVCVGSLFLACLKPPATLKVHLMVRSAQTNCTYCRTQLQTADHTCYPAQPKYTDTGPTTPNTDPTTPDSWLGSHLRTSLSVPGMAWPGKAGGDTPISCSWGHQGGSEGRGGWKIGTRDWNWKKGGGGGANWMICWPALPSVAHKQWKSYIKKPLHLQHS